MIGLALSRRLVACRVPRLGAQDKFIVVASTTSTEQSGLFAHLLPVFEKDTGIKVRVVAVGTGQALDIGRRGDADVVFVHDTAAEDKFMAEGEGVKRYPVMYNDFVLIGPRRDPAKVAGGKDILDGVPQGRGRAKAPFVSRGDKSGTHAAELASGRMQASTSTRRRARGIATRAPAWAPALNTASSMNAYILADRGTWLVVQESRRPRDPRRRRQAALQPVRRDARQSRQAPERQAGARARRSSTGSSRRAGRR